MGAVTVPRTFHSAAGPVTRWHLRGVPGQRPLTSEERKEQASYLHPQTTPRGAYSRSRPASRPHFCPSTLAAGHCSVSSALLALHSAAQERQFDRWMSHLRQSPRTMGNLARAVSPTGREDLLPRCEQGRSPICQATPGQQAVLAGLWTPPPAMPGSCAPHANHSPPVLSRRSGAIIQSFFSGVACSSSHLNGMQTA